MGKGISMPHYIIKSYQKGFERDQARIGIEAARNWIWPYAYHEEDLVRIHAQSDFDPDTRHYCFLDDEMVGYMFSSISPPGERGVINALLDFPRMVAGHEGAAEILVSKAIETLKGKGVSQITGHITTMCPGDIDLAQKMGFSISDWGFKVYYAYEMAWGKLAVNDAAAVNIDPSKDLPACAHIAAHWYQRPAEWCLTRLEAWHAEGLIAHLGIRKQENLVASCLVAPNDVRDTTAAIYYIYTPDAQSLEPMLAKVVSSCITYGCHDVIADLINAHRQYEPVYKEIGFKKAAEWARCTKTLD
jgi:hypothetical protein